MVKLIREFFLNGFVRDVFDKIMTRLPGVIRREDGDYKVIDEIVEKDRLYRKALIHKQNMLEMIPAFIKEHLPETLLHTATRLIDESIFYTNHDEYKIQWSITNECDRIYSISGTTRFIEMSDTLCKVVILVHLRIEGLERYISNATTRDMVRPMLESKIPDLFIDNLRDIYTLIISESY